MDATLEQQSEVENTLRNQVAQLEADLAEARAGTAAASTPAHGDNTQLQEKLSLYEQEVRVQHIHVYRGTNLL